MFATPALEILAALSFLSFSLSFGFGFSFLVSLFLDPLLLCLLCLLCLGPLLDKERARQELEHVREELRST